LKRELERMGLDAASADGVTAEGLKAGSTAEQKARESSRLVRGGRRLQESMPSGAVSPGKDIAVDILSSIKPSIGQFAGSNMYDRDQKKWRADANRMDQDLSALAAGMALTGFEIENKQKWSPMAPGISEQDAQDRWEVIRNTFGTKADAARGIGGIGGIGGLAGPRNRKKAADGSSWVQTGPDEWEEE
jgi:hypothetical protein